MVNDAFVDYSTPATHDGRKYTVRVPSLQVAKCDNCGDITLGDDASRRITARSIPPIATPLRI